MSDNNSMPSLQTDIFEETVYDSSSRELVKLIPLLQYYGPN